MKRLGCSELVCCSWDWNLKSRFFKANFRSKYCIIFGERKSKIYFYCVFFPKALTLYELKNNFQYYFGMWISGPKKQHKKTVKWSFKLNIFCSNMWRKTYNLIKLYQTKKNCYVLWGVPPKLFTDRFFFSTTRYPGPTLPFLGIWNQNVFL